MIDTSTTVKSALASAAKTRGSSRHVSVRKSADDQAHDFLKAVGLDSREKVSRAIQSANNEFVDEGSAEKSLNDLIACKNAGDMLERHYPGWEWSVYVADGIMQIRATKLSGEYGYVLHVDKIDNDLKRVKNAGGEILERFGMRRGGFREQELHYNARYGFHGSTKEIRTPTGIKRVFKKTQAVWRRTYGMLFDE